MNIPENKNGVPDLLDEVRWELEFELKMQVPEGEKLAGMVHHKVHDRSGRSCRLARTRIRWSATCSRRARPRR